MSWKIRFERVVTSCYDCPFYEDNPTSNNGWHKINYCSAGNMDGKFYTPTNTFLLPSEVNNCPLLLKEVQHDTI